MTADEIRELRKRLVLTQAEFGQLVGAHGMTVSRWELGLLHPTTYQQALLDAFRAAVEKQQFDQTVKSVLVGAGIVAALLLLLKRE